MKSIIQIPLVSSTKEFQKFLDLAVTNYMKTTTEADIQFAKDEIKKLSDLYLKFSDLDYTNMEYKQKQEIKAYYKLVSQLFADFIPKYNHILSTVVLSNILEQFEQTHLSTHFQPVQIQFYKEAI